jgi:hypothetical protein
MVKSLRLLPVASFGKPGPGSQGLRPSRAQAACSGQRGLLATTLATPSEHAPRQQVAALTRQFRRIMSRKGAGRNCRVLDLDDRRAGMLRARLDLSGSQ